MPGPALPPYSRRDRPAYDSSRTRRCSQTSATYSAGAGALAPIAHTGSYATTISFAAGDVEQRFQLRETGLGGLRWGTTLVLAHAVQRHQSLPDDLGNLRLDTGVVLAEKPSPLGMTNLDVPTTKLGEDLDRDLAGLGAVR